MHSKPYLKTVVMNWIVTAIFVTLGVVVLYFGRHDQGQSIAVVAFLAMVYLVIPFTSVLTALTLARSVVTWRTTASFALNLIVCVFAALLLLGALIAGRFNIGLVIAFVPFVINLASLSAHKSDPQGMRV